VIDLYNQIFQSEDFASADVKFFDRNETRQQDSILALGNVLEGESTKNANRHGLAFLL